MEDQRIAVPPRPLTLGVDISYRMPGFAILNGREKLLDWDRPNYTAKSTIEIAFGITKIIRKLMERYRPSLVVIESVKHAQFKGQTNHLTLDALAVSRGIVWGALSMCDPVPTILEAGVNARLEVTGLRKWPKGSDTKKLIKDFLVMRGIELPPGTDKDPLYDVSDAAALALWGQVMVEEQRLLALASIQQPTSRKKAIKLW